MTHKAKVRRCRKVAHKTVAIEVEKPAGFSFRPGGHVAFELTQPLADGGRNWRAFSIASAPHDDHLLFLSRIGQSPFKQAIGQLKAGDDILVSEPSGSFFLPPETNWPLILFAGGIGITPFRSMVKYVVEQKTPHQLTLFYSNRRPEDAAGLGELAAWADANPSFTFVPLMTRPEKSPVLWRGHTGYLNDDLLARYVGPAKQKLFYLAGTPRFVSGARDLLLAYGVPEYAIRLDEFEGY